MQTPATSLAKSNSELFVLDVTRALPAQVEDPASFTDIRNLGTTMGGFSYSFKDELKDRWRLETNRLQQLTKPCTTYATDLRLPDLDGQVDSCACTISCYSILCIARSHATCMIRT